MTETAARAISLVVVDDHPVVRDGLRGMFAAAPDSTSSARRRTAWTPSRPSNASTPTSS